MQLKTRIGLGLLLCLSLLTASNAMPTNIISAAKNGDDHAVRKLLEKDPGLARSTDDRGFTPLHWAGVRGHWHAFRHLIEAGAPVNAVGGDGGTPLHWACHHDRADMVRLLLEQGGDIALANQWGRVAMHVAARRGCLAVAALLLDAGADSNARTREGWTPLHVAYKAGHPRMIELLLARGADPEATDDQGRRPYDQTLQRPAAIELTTQQLDEYVGHYDLGPGYSFKIWREGGGLCIQEFAPDGLYPIGRDLFHCVQEPWRVTFQRDAAGAVTSVAVDFLRRTVQGQRRNHPHYVGSQACRECHLGDEHGNQYMQWVTSRHASAYWRLATDWAKLLASFRPAYRDVTEPISEKRCLLCHITVAQDPEALAAGSYRIEEGVGCEVCHGPGSLYMDPEIMSDREQFLAHGGVVPDETTCLRCHRNPERFDFATWWPKIDHTRGADSGH